MLHTFATSWQVLERVLQAYGVEQQMQLCMWPNDGQHRPQSRGGHSTLKCDRYPEKCLKVKLVLSGSNSR